MAGRITQFPGTQPNRLKEAVRLAEIRNAESFEAQAAALEVASRALRTAAQCCRDRAETL